jgi:hypothetical protein
MVALTGPLATASREPRQARKGATVVVTLCAEVWLVRVTAILLVISSYLQLSPVISSYLQLSLVLSISLSLLETYFGSAFLSLGDSSYSRILISRQSADQERSPCRLLRSLTFVRDDRLECLR